jgi:hypothetical protein
MSTTKPRVSFAAHTALAIAAAVGVCVIGIPAVAADANASPRIPVENQPFDIPAQYCGFPIHVGVLDDNEYYVHSTNNPDGSSTLRVTGRLINSLTNENTGKTITYDNSGPGWITLYPDGSDHADVQGHSFGLASPASQLALGVPGLFLTTGHAIATYDASGDLSSLSIAGQLTDGCALLS